MASRAYSGGAFFLSTLLISIIAVIGLQWAAYCKYVLIQGLLVIQDLILAEIL